MPRGQRKNIPYSQKRPGIDSFLMLALEEIYTIALGQKGHKITAIKIANHLGISKESLYQIFGTKEPRKAACTGLICDIIDFIESEFPGAKSYFGMRVAGLDRQIAYSSCFSTIDYPYHKIEAKLAKVDERYEKAHKYKVLEKKDIEGKIDCSQHINEDAKAFLKDIKAKGAEAELLKEIPKDKKRIAKMLSLTSKRINYEIFTACLKREDFFTYYKRRNFPYGFANSLITYAINIGADMDNLAENLSVQQMKELLELFDTAKTENHTPKEARRLTFVKIQNAKKHLNNVF